MPLISLSHLAFSSAGPVSDLPEAELEKVCQYQHHIATVLFTLAATLPRQWTKSVGQLAEPPTHTSSMPSLDPAQQRPCAA